MWICVTRTRQYRNTSAFSIKVPLETPLAVTHSMLNKCPSTYLMKKQKQKQNHIEEVIRANQDIILMGGFNETIGSNVRMIEKVLTARRLIDVHVN